jgi:hypothetical protein
MPRDRDDPRCRFCGCREDRACPGGCAWLDVAQTVCTACRAIAVAWAALPSRRPSMVRAFFRGYAVGTGDPRAQLEAPANPYGVGGEAWRFWYYGHEAATGRRLAGLKPAGVSVRRGR